MWRQLPGATTTPCTSASPASHNQRVLRRHVRGGEQQLVLPPHTPLSAAARGDRDGIIQRTSSAIQRSDHDSSTLSSSTTTTTTTTTTAMNAQEGGMLESPPLLSYSTMEVEEFAPLSPSSSSLPSQKRIFVNLDAPTLQTGRILVLVASLIYGTNFATVKMLDDSLPLSISATLRFGLASAVVSAIVLSREDEHVEAIVVKERNLAMSSGLEIGMWYCIGYICQAEGLQTVTAGKVRGWISTTPATTCNPIVIVDKTFV
jgi:hypothetical protein